MLFIGQDIFELPFEPNEPFYVDQAWIDSHPETPLELNAATNKTYLYTMVFQTFVFMQLFNQINARKLGANDFNVFAGFFNNGMFLFICAITFVV
jgi:magnesium-transporting ATPase (P-type)